MAATGFGVWALVAQQLVNLGLNAIMLWILSKWRPQWVYSWTSFRELFSFGSKLLASGLLDTLYNNIYQIVIGTKVLNYIAKSLLVIGIAFLSKFMQSWKVI